MNFGRLTPFRGVGGYGPSREQMAEPTPEHRFAQGMGETRLAGTFYARFPELPLALAGQRVLDFGCGFGGKAIAYAEHAEFVAGVEPFEHVIALCEAYRHHVGAPNVEFRVCTQDRIPYPDDAFDAVFAHDVLEHVENPSVSLREIARVLKLGGIAYLVFPPYDGAFSHHLDYASRLPGLHWMFSPHTLVAAANRAIRTWNIRGVSEQPAPRTTWDGERYVLPGLNGLTGPQFEQLAGTRFDRDHIRYWRTPPLTLRHVPAVLIALMIRPLGWLGSAWRDRITLSISAKLVKRG